MVRSSPHSPTSLPRTSGEEAAPRHVYIHVPFCARRCSYCDFSIAVRREVPVDEYLHALDAELSLRFPDANCNEVDTIYFGGGTPSRLGGDGLARALEIITQRFTPARVAELTVEANPDDMDPAALRTWHAAGVNRLSIGSQSFDDRALAWMHRVHDSAAIARSVADARQAGFANLSLDLIFALPEALQRDFERDVERALALEPDHVSLYGLTVEPATPLGRWVAAGREVEQPDEGYERDYLLAHRLLTSAGFEHYEVSNYARPGRRAAHNSAYWAAVPYVGLGPAAHEFNGDARRWNARAYTDWLRRIADGRDPVEGSETLTAENRVAEEVYLGLRSDGGLLLGADEWPVVGRWVEAGWATLSSEGVLRCTAEGWLRLDSLAASLTNHRSR
jgi:putative oxygen-independent coproporphyrinogen III oxidase